MSRPVRNAHQPLRLGIIGCGKVVERLHLPALMRSSDWQVVAAFDPLVERRAWIRQACPGVALYERLEDLCAQPEIDACLIATPPATHYATATNVLEAGQHALIEKPVTLALSEAQHLRDLAYQHQKQLWVGFNRRFALPYMRLRERLRAMSPAVSKRIHFSLVFDIENWNPISSRLGDDAKGSGVLDDVVSHQSDLLAWLLNQPVHEVLAAQHATDGQGMQSIVYAVVFQDGTVAECIAGHGSQYVEHLEMQVQGQTLVVYPSGLLVTRSLPVRVIRPLCHSLFMLNLVMHKLTGTRTVAMRSFERQWSAFAQALRDHDAPTTGADAASGVQSVQVVQACRESLRSGGRYQIDRGNT